jgi:hypothetical protein
MTCPTSGGSLLLYVSVCPFLPPLTQDTKTLYEISDLVEGTRSIAWDTQLSHYESANYTVSVCNDIIEINSDPTSLFHGLAISSQV